MSSSSKQSHLKTWDTKKFKIYVSMLRENCNQIIIWDSVLILENNCEWLHTHCTSAQWDHSSDSCQEFSSEFHLSSTSLFELQQLSSQTDSANRWAWWYYLCQSVYMKSWIKWRDTFERSESFCLWQNEWLIVQIQESE